MLYDHTNEECRNDVPAWPQLSWPVGHPNCGRTQNPITELRQLFITSHQEQIKISRFLLAAQQPLTEAVEASLRLTRRLMLVHLWPPLLTVRSSVWFILPVYKTERDMLVNLGFTEQQQC